MGTRADFYVGKGEKAEWLGSIAWDGYPGGIDEVLLKCNDEGEYRIKTTRFIASRDDGTLFDQGWPWPWNDSKGTDYAYTFVDGKVKACCYGHGWFDPTNEPEDYDELPYAQFPNMEDIQNVTLGKRSGVLILNVPKDE